MNFDEDAFVQAEIKSKNNTDRENKARISFPATKKDIQDALSEIGVDNKNTEFTITSCILNLKSNTEYGLPDNVHIDELNSLALSIMSFGYEDFDKFESALSISKNTSIGHILEIAENIDCFDLIPAYDFAGYGEILLDQHKDSFAESISRIWNIENDEGMSIADYIERLEECVDVEAYGKIVALEEKGTFTDYGYLLKNKEFEYIYTDINDIDEDIKIFAYPEPKPVPSFELKGIKNDVMLGKYLYDNNMMPKEQKLTLNLKLNFTSHPEKYFKMLGKKHREANNGVFIKNGYAEFNKNCRQKSVLEQIAINKANDMSVKSDKEGQAKKDRSDR